MQHCIFFNVINSLTTKYLIGLAIFKLSFFGISMLILIVRLTRDVGVYNGGKVAIISARMVCSFERKRRIRMIIIHL